MLLDFQLMGFPRCVWRSTSLPLLSLPFLSLHDSLGACVRVRVCCVCVFARARS